MVIETQAEEKSRIVWADAIKVLAAAFVIILHFSGYVAEINPTEGYSGATMCVYRFFEAYSYPSIHLFFLVSAYFLLDSCFKVKSLIKLYITTLLVTVTGLVMSVILLPDYMSIEGIIACFFPVTTSAYWFITSYAVLLLITPILNVAIRHMTLTQLNASTSLLVLLIVIIPSLLPVKEVFVSGGGCVPVVVTLYFIAAVIKRNKSGGNKWKWLVLSTVSAIMMTLSTFVIEYASLCIGFLAGRVFTFYQYDSVFTFVSAVSIFMLFKDTKINNKVISNSISFLAKYTLYIFGAYASNYKTILHTRKDPWMDKCTESDYIHCFIVVCYRLRVYCRSFSRFHCK